MDVTNDGTDAAQMPPMLDQIEKSYGHRPETCLVDSAFATRESVTGESVTGESVTGESVTGESVTGAGQQGTTVAGGIPRGRELEKKDIDPHTKQRGDTPESVEFRERMGPTSIASCSNSVRVWRSFPTPCAGTTVFVSSWSAGWRR